MEPFTTLTGIAAPLLRPNIDTDIIIRIERLIGGDPKSLGPYAFESWRYRPDGSEDPDFVLNREPFRRARILIAGENFGCGSSREGAVWALQGFGILCIIAPSFGDIFFNNCFQNGVLPIRLERPTIERLVASLAGDPARPVSVDLRQSLILAPLNERLSFAVDPGRRAALLQGLDEIGRTLRHDQAIAAFQARDRAERPWVYAAETRSEA
ncbi:MAG TPA: 3-isopropylmalate dehydratase small subunit [Stellaceae bacterium]|nr:3-isopropylmalate dehydratase small subunit [Stellaceae bacterium]